MYNENIKLKVWIHDTIASIPRGISLDSAIQIEEELKELYKKISGQQYDS